MEQTTDYYALLGVDETASSEVIKKAFKRMALKYHPDVYKGEDAEEKTREILRAYQTLSDPAQRRSYDVTRTGHSSISAGTGVKAQSTDITPEAQYDRQRHYAFPPFNDGQPAQVDLGEITYLFSASEVRKLKEQGMLRGLRPHPQPRNITAIAASTAGGRAQSQNSVRIVRREIGESTWYSVASIAMQSSKVNRFATRSAPCNTETANYVRPTSYFRCVPTAASPSGVQPKKNACGTYVIAPQG